ncbi:MAG: glycosyltransferase family 39 protein, partial [Deltaproteobacteria bacterium]|nr:glycosyltransferase family 39 protein [Deltaproteobacteria bacterium]
MVRPRPTLTDLGVFALAAAVRLGLYGLFRPEGLEPDGVGLAAQFWHARETANAIPGWWSDVMASVAGYWPPAYSACIAAVAAVTGDPFLSGRIVSALAAGGCAVLVARLARSLTDDRIAGLLAGLFVATTPLSIAWDVRVRPESLFLFFVVATILECRQANSTPTARKGSMAIAFAGLAFFTKYEAIVLIPPLLWFGARNVLARRVAQSWTGWAALTPWAAGMAWMLTHRAARVGDYGDLLTANGLIQIPVWSFWTIINALDVYSWGTALLVGLGVWRWWRSRRERTTFVMLAWIAGCFVVMIAAGYNWSSRYLLLLLPAVALFAAHGLLAIRNARLRVAVVVVVAVSNLGIAQNWVRAEKDRWGETRRMALAISRQVPATATIWSDDPYLTPWWAKRDVRPLENDSVPAPGDYV